MGVSAETFATAPAALDWLSTTAWLVAHGALVALPIVFAVVAAYNLAPQRAWGRNVVLALTLAVASFGGVALSFAVDYVAKDISGEFLELFASALRRGIAKARLEREKEKAEREEFIIDGFQWVC